MIIWNIWIIAIIWFIFDYCKLLSLFWLFDHRSGGLLGLELWTCGLRRRVFSAAALVHLPCSTPRARRPSLPPSGGGREFPGQMRCALDPVSLTSRRFVHRRGEGPQPGRQLAYSRRTRPGQLQSIQEIGCAARVATWWLRRTNMAFRCGHRAESPASGNSQRGQGYHHLKRYINRL